MRYWLDFGSMSISVCCWLEFWLDFGSISISVCCVGPRLGSCNLATPKTGFLQIFTSKKWVLAEASGLNWLNFQN